MCKMNRSKEYFRLQALVVLLLIFGVHSVALSQQVLRGQVVDSLSNKPVAFANISVFNKALGATANEQGYFELSLSNTESVTLVFSHVSYFRKDLKLSGGSMSKKLTVYLQPKQQELSDVVVSASLYEQPMDKLTKSAAVLSHRDIAMEMSGNLVDMLNAIPGFSQIWEYHSPILLRGLNSKRILIMKDGNRRIGTFPGGYFAQDVNVYESKKVEIIKGPGSVIYGSGAISGIINTFSREPWDCRRNHASMITGYGANNNEFLQVINAGHNQGKWGVNVHGKFRKSDNYVYGNGMKAENTQVEDRDFSLNTGVKLSPQQNLRMNVSYHYGDWGKPRGFNGPGKYFTEIRNEEERLHLSLAHQWNTSGIFTKIHTNLYYDEGTRDYFKGKYNLVTDQKSATDIVHYKDHYGGGRVYGIAKLSENQSLTTGVDGYFFRLENPTEVVDYYNDTRGTVPGYKDAGQQAAGAFLQYDYQPSEHWQWISGVRYDYALVQEGSGPYTQDREESRQAVSGNVGGVYTHSELFHASWNVGRAFRMPTAEELFTKIISCKGTKEGNPDLQPEYSWNFDLGFRGKTLNKNWKYDLSLFYNIMDDYIQEVAAIKPDVDYTYNNVDAHLMGGEVSVLWKKRDVIKKGNRLLIDVGAAYVYGIDKSAADDDAALFGIPPFRTTTHLRYQGLFNRSFITGYQLRLGWTFAAKQNRVAKLPDEMEAGPWGYYPSDAFHTLDAGFAIMANTLPGHPKFNIIIKNLLDNDYQPFGSYIPAVGRNIKCTIQFNLNT